MWKSLYRLLYRWGFKASGAKGYRHAMAVRLMLTLGGGLLILKGFIAFPVKLYLAIFMIVLVWSAYVWRVSKQARIGLDLMDLFLDCTLIVILLRYTGGSQSPFVFVVYLWLMAMFATNLRVRTWRPMAILTMIAYGLLIIGAWGTTSFGFYLFVHAMGMIMLIVVANVFTHEILRREVDALTGVLTRLTGLEALREWMEIRPGFHLIFLDLTRFKEVNDRFGHLVGDEILAEVGSRLRSRVRPDDLVIRYGGDEFLVASAASDLEQRVQACFQDPIATRYGSIQIGAKIGCVRHRPGEDLDELLRRADALVFNQGKGREGKRV